MRDDVLDQLRAENPVPQLLPALPLEVIRQRLDAAPIDRGPSRRRVSLNVYRRRRMVLSGVMAAVVLAVAGVVGFRTAATPQPALAAQMNRLAQIVVNQKWIGRPGPGAVPLHQGAEPFWRLHPGQRRTVCDRTCRSFPSLDRHRWCRLIRQPPNSAIHLSR